VGFKNKALRKSSHSLQTDTLVYLSVILGTAARFQTERRKAAQPATVYQRSACTDETSQNAPAETGLGHFNRINPGSVKCIIVHAKKM